MHYKYAAHVLLVATKIERNPGRLRSDLSYLLLIVLTLPG